MNLLKQIEKEELEYAFKSQIAGRIIWRLSIKKFETTEQQLEKEWI